MTAALCLIAGAISESGAAHTLLNLGETRDIVMTVSELVILEPERSITRKSPSNLDDLRKLIKSTNLRIVPNPSKEEIKANLYLISDPNDIPILLAVTKNKVDYLATQPQALFR